uniref:high affinity immunoglobulin epsilon receptor subunit beta-like isoform X1 n=2 Tax=Pristiophorus japonicus TaxID=55135 RepID=UPI00398E5B54
MAWGRKDQRNEGRSRGVKQHLEMEESKSTVTPEETPKDILTPKDIVTSVETVHPSEQPSLFGQNSLEMFMFKELKALGATQFVAGIVQMTFGIPLIYHSTVSIAGMLGAVWWTGVWCSISGVMNMFLHNSSNIILIRVSLPVNCLSTFVTGAGIALYVTSIILALTDESIYLTNTSFAIIGLMLLFAVVSMIISFAVFVIYGKLVLQA